MEDHVFGLVVELVRLLDLLAGHVLAQDEGVVAAEEDAVPSHLLDEVLEGVDVVHERVDPNAPEVVADTCKQAN